MPKKTCQISPIEPPEGEQSGSDKRSRREKYFLVTICAMTIVIVLLIIGLCCKLYGKCDAQQEDFCSTRGCVLAASSIIESLDENVDPCHDFYKFACGNAIRKTSIPEDKSYVSKFNVVDDEITQQLRTMLEEPVGKDDITPIISTKNYFRACMNEELIEEQGQNPIKDLLKSLGGWPVLEEDSWNEKEFHWTNLVYKLRKLGLPTTNFLELSVATDPTHSNVRIVELDQPTNFGLGREFLVGNTHLDTYLGLMVNISVQLGANQSTAEEELKESLEFEIQLANISLPTEERHNITKLVNHMSINELQKKYPITPWIEYINNILLLDEPLRSDDIILVVVPSYFSSFEEIIKNTPRRVQANYALWRVVQDLLPFLPKDVYQHFSNALKIIAGQATRPLRWKECTEGTSSSLPFLVSSLYIRKYFDVDTKTNALEMVRYLKSTFKDMLQASEWMDDATRKKALDKVEKMAEHVGYPDELLNNSLLEKHYHKLDIRPDQYLKSYLNIQLLKTDFIFNRLREPVDKADWTEHGAIASADASYRILENSIFVTAGILQGTFFNKNRPRYLNFGAIGSVIGHEITHGFDDQGRQFDENGNLINWWESTTEKSFLDKTLCMIYQYGNYTVSEVNKTINGNKTQGENIADNGGLKEAYLAYKAWVKDNAEEQKLPGLEYSSKQLFWISAAMNWCTNYKEQYLEAVVASDSHSPNEFRVLGPFSNSKEFAEDFHCPIGSRMNPLNKCAVW